MTEAMAAAMAEPQAVGSYMALSFAAAGVGNGARLIWATGYDRRPDPYADPYGRSGGAYGGYGGGYGGSQYDDRAGHAAYDYGRAPAHEDRPEAR
ncbi:hypothetical protein HaLaN_13632, partial [Haematococcus lacustris]